MTTKLSPKGINIQNVVLIQLNRKDLPQNDDSNLKQELE